MDSRSEMMDHTFIEPRPQDLAGAPRLPMSLGLVAVLIFGACVLLALHQLNPPPAVDAYAPLSEFSSARAFNHLASIAARPRQPRRCARGL